MYWPGLCQLAAAIVVATVAATAATTVVRSGKTVVATAAEQYDDKDDYPAAVSAEAVTHYALPPFRGVSELSLSLATLRYHSMIGFCFGYGFDFGLISKLTKIKEKMRNQKIFSKIGQF